MKSQEISGIQLKMNFEASGDNRFKELLDNGVFNVLVEIEIPRSDSKIDHAVARYSELQNVVAAEKTLPVGLAFLDSNPNLPSVNMGEFAARLCPTGRDSHVFYLSGRDKSRDDIAAEIAFLSSERFRNIVAVSGNAPLTLSANAAHRYFESVEILRKNQEMPIPMFGGCAVNPYKYTIADSMAQYFKLSKKLNAGAAFAVTQIGWDMRKLQELRWNMFRKNQNVPTLARFIMLTPERAEDICAGRCPGISLAPDFKEAVREEMAHSLAQFEAAQLRRLQIHVAGAMLLGYTGIQIAGIDRPGLLKIVLSRIMEALQEFRTPTEWMQAHNDYYARMELAPYPFRYYLYEKLLDPEQTFETARLNTAETVPACSWTERKRYLWGKRLLHRSGTLPAGERRLTKKLIASCPGTCSRCVLPSTHYVCPEICPKKMKHGPCGDSLMSGKCPLLGRECIHDSRIRRAVEWNDYDSLEQI